MEIINNKFLRGLLNVWSLCGMALFAVTIFCYLNWQGFAEQGEVNFATVSWLLYQGHPLYTDIDFAGRYSLQHGPIVYLLAGGIMKLLGPGYVTAKLSGILALLTGIVVSWLWFTKLIGKKPAFLLLGLEIWMLFHWHHAYFIRPDSMMLLCVIVSMYMITTKRNSLLLILGLAIPMAIMINLKIHGVLYFLPIVTIAYRRLGWKKLFYAGGITLLLSVLPFLVPGISFDNYLLWLFQSLHHGFSIGNFIPKIAVVMSFFLLTITIGVICGGNIRSCYQGNKHTVHALLFSLLVVSIIASKGGSGTNHLTPFIPIFNYFIMLLIAEGKKSNPCFSAMHTTVSRNVSGIILAILLVLITVSGITTEQRLIETVVKNDRSLMVQEVETIEKEYAGKTIEVGYGEEKSYYQYRDLIPLPVFAGNPLLVEIVALGDMNTAGWKIPENTIRSLETGTIQVWLIPRGNIPFYMGNIPEGKVFPESFRQAFFRNYTLTSSTDFFDIWVYGGKEGSARDEVRQ